MSSQPFQSQRTFFDRKNFPYGFARSGVFSNRQAALLESHGQAYSNLAAGIRTPEGPEEVSFVAFCQGLKEPTTEHEKIWDIYQRTIGAKQLGYISMSLKAEKPEQSVSEDFEDGDYEIA
jgi:uncharacterized protein YifE (UPF0438 family)